MVAPSARRLFPLPRLRSAPGIASAVVPAGDPGRCIDLADAVLRTLDELDAGGEVAHAPTSLSVQHAATVDTVLAQTARFDAFPRPFGSDADAFDSVCGGDDYRGDPIAFALLDESKLSLRPCGSEPIPLDVLLASGGKQVVDEFLTKCLLPTKKASQSLAEIGPDSVFVDPGIRRSTKRYHALIRRMYGCGMLDWSDWPVLEIVGFFCVKKKNGKLRFVVDCRRANHHFVDPDHTDLLTCASYVRLHLDGDACLYSGQFDRRDAFYHMPLPECLRDYFALESVPAHVFGLRHLPAHQLVHPRLKVLPMGGHGGLGCGGAFHVRYRAYLSITPLCCLRLCRQFRCCC